MFQQTKNRKKIGISSIIDGIPVSDPNIILKYNPHLQNLEFSILQSLFESKIGDMWRKNSLDATNSSPYKIITDMLNEIGRFLESDKFIKSKLIGEERVWSLNKQRDAICRHLLSSYARIQLYCIENFY